eukprot:gene5436-6447_t
MIGVEQESWMPMMTAALYMPVAVEAHVFKRTVGFREDLCAGIHPLDRGAFRDYYAPEIYGGVLGRTPTPADYLLADWPGGIFATIALAMLVKVEDNRRAVLLMHLGIMFGAVLLLATTLGYSNAGLDPMLWVTVSTCGLMLMYTPTGSFLYDRLMAASGTPGTTSFLVFLSDGLGYIAVVAILLAKTFAASDDANGGNVESVGLDWNDIQGFAATTPI